MNKNKNQANTPNLTEYMNKQNKIASTGNLTVIEQNLNKKDCKKKF